MVLVPDADSLSGCNAPDKLSVRKFWPAPWVNGEHALKGDFYSFRDDSGRAWTEPLCCICGGELGPVVAIAAMGGVQETAGGWGHPRCVDLSVTLCPHFTDAKGTVAFLVQDGTIGIVEPVSMSIDEIVPSATPLDRTALRALAKADPAGLAPTNKCPMAH